MRPSYKVKEVRENIQISQDIFKLVIEGECQGSPGQFYMVKGWDKEPLLLRPLSINDIEDGRLSFLYEVRGEGTKLLSNLKKGDKIELLGPLGNGFDIDNIKGNIAIVSGGIGIAPLIYTIKSLRNCNVDLYAGFRDSSYEIESLKDNLNKITISTDGGKEGHEGFITEVFNPKGYDMVLCCGPEIMMKKVVNMCHAEGVKVYVSMESHMACGVGACLGCTCKTKDGNKRVCKEGPVFLGEEVMIDA